MEPPMEYADTDRTVATPTTPGPAGDAGAAGDTAALDAAVFDAQLCRAWIDEAARLVVENTDHLTHLDAAIGDADHGVNMRRGFEAGVLHAPRTVVFPFDEASSAYKAVAAGTDGAKVVLVP